MPAKAKASAAKAGTKAAGRGKTVAKTKRSPAASRSPSPVAVPSPKAAAAPKGKAGAAAAAGAVSAEERKTQAMAASVGKAFTDCSNSFALHNRSLAPCRKLYASDTDRFNAAFIACLNRVLIVWSRDERAERVVRFVSRFATQNYDGSGDAAAAAADAADANAKPNANVNANAKEQKADAKAPASPAPAAAAAVGGDRQALNELRDAFTVSILGYLLHRIGAKDKAVRFRCCQLIGQILSELGADAELDNSVFDRIRDALLIRLADSHATVRAMACAAAVRVQDAADDCPVSAEYVRLITTDANKDVRRAAVMYVGIKPDTLPILLRALRDVHPAVSAEAFKVVGDKVPLQSLSIAQRIEVLRIGLTDRNPAVQRACSALLCDKWLPSKNGNAAALLESLDVENASEDAERVLRHVLSKGLCLPAATAAAAANVHNIVLPLRTDGLTSATALYWRVTCDFLRDAKREELLDKCLPATVDFPALIAAHAKASRADEDDAAAATRAFIAQQLLRLCLHVDWADESGRRLLSDFMCGLLRDLSTAEELVVHINKVLRRIYYSDESAYLTAAFRIMAEVRGTADAKAAPAAAAAAAAPAAAPMSPVKRSAEQQKADARHAELVHAVEQWTAERETAKEEDNAELDAQLKQKIDAAEAELAVLEANNKRAASPEKAVAGASSDANSSMSAAGAAGDAQCSDEAWIRVLSIADEVLRYTRRDLHHAGLMGVFETHLQPAFIVGSNPLIRRGAIQCMGLYCALDRGVARDHLPLFYQCIAHEQHMLKSIGVRAVCDLLLLFPGITAEPVPAPAPVAPVAPANVDAKHGADAVAAAAAAPAKAAEPAPGGAMSMDTLVRALLACVTPVEAAGEDDGADEDDEEAVAAREQLRVRRELRFTATEALCKLMIADRFRVPLSLPLPAVAADGVTGGDAKQPLSSAEVLSALLGLYFDPSTALDTPFRQCLSVFFPAYASLDDVHRQHLFDAFYPVLCGLSARDAAPEAVTALLQYYITLLQQPPQKEKPAAADADNTTAPAAGADAKTAAAAAPSGSTVGAVFYKRPFHERLALDALVYVCADPLTAATTKPLCNALAVLAQALPTAASSASQAAVFARVLRVVLAEARAELRDKMSLKALDKADAAFAGVDPAHVAAAKPKRKAKKADSDDESEADATDSDAEDDDADEKKASAKAGAKKTATDAAAAFAEHERQQIAQLKRDRTAVLEHWQQQVGGGAEAAADGKGKSKAKPKTVKALAASVAESRPKRATAGKRAAKKSPAAARKGSAAKGKAAANGKGKDKGKGKAKAKGKADKWDSDQSETESEAQSESEAESDAEDGDLAGSADDDVAELSGTEDAAPAPAAAAAAAEAKAQPKAAAAAAADAKADPKAAKLTAIAKEIDALIDSDADADADAADDAEDGAAADSDAENVPAAAARANAKPAAPTKAAAAATKGKAAAAAAAPAKGKGKAKAAPAVRGTAKSKAAAKKTIDRDIDALLS